MNRSKHTTIISKQTIRDIKKAARESFGVKRAAYQMSTAPTTAEADDYVPDVREWHASAYSGCRDVVQLTDLEGKEVADGCILDVYVDEPGADGEHLGCVPIRLDLHWDRGTCYVRTSEADEYPDPDPVLPEDRVAPDDPETEPEEAAYEDACEAAFEDRCEAVSERPEAPEVVPPATKEAVAAKVARANDDPARGIEARSTGQWVYITGRSAVREEWLVVQKDDRFMAVAVHSADTMDLGPVSAEAAPHASTSC